MLESAFLFHADVQVVGCISDLQYSKFGQLGVDTAFGVVVRLTKIHLLFFLVGFIRRCSNIVAGPTCLDFLKRRAPFRSSLAESSSTPSLPPSIELSLLLLPLDKLSGLIESLGENSGVSSATGTIPFTESLHSVVVSIRIPFLFQHSLPSWSTVTR